MSITVCCVTLTYQTWKPEDQCCTNDCTLSLLTLPTLKFIDIVKDTQCMLQNVVWLVVANVSDNVILHLNLLDHISFEIHFSFTN